METNIVLKGKKLNEKIGDVGKIGFSEPVIVDFSSYRKVLITGADSYIGVSFENYVQKKYIANFKIDTIDLRDGSWRYTSFSDYDAVFHVAGIAHADVGKVSEETKKKYYAVNTDLAIEVAKKAKNDGVKQFVFMSSMIVYGESARYGQSKVITRSTKPSPANFYGDSKWQADQGVRALADDNFNVTVLRPPMIYGKGSKGNYPTLTKLAKKLPVFPKVENKRSMLHIDNLCEFLCQIMLIGKGGIFIPQNAEYTNTSEMVKEIAEASGRKIRESAIFTPVVWLGSKMPGKIGALVNKAFGNMVYDQSVSRYEGIDYQKVGLKESIVRTERKVKEKPRALIIASVASMIDQFNMDNINILLEQDYEVDVITNFKEPGNISADRAKNLRDSLLMKGVTVYHVQIPRSLSCVCDIFASYRIVKKLCDERQYDIVHCHSPIGGVIARFAARKIRFSGSKVIYTAHGFHFYDGAPKRNWMIFYPIEKFCSRLTDVLITINEEDYSRAKKKFYASRVIRIPGVGVDTNKFAPFMSTKEKRRKQEEIGIPENAYLILSVGELNDNKNQQLVLRSIAEIGDTRIHYVMAGVGRNRSKLEQLARELGIEANTHFLGYRTDIVELDNCADVFAFASIREGLGMASLEALSCGVPIVGMNTRGIKEYVIDGVTGYLFDNDVNSCKIALKKALSLLETDSKKLRTNCRKTAMKFSISTTHKIMETIYLEFKKEYTANNMLKTNI